MNTLKAGVAYFALVFCTGLMLGTIRTLWIVSRLGVSRGLWLVHPCVTHHPLL